MATTGENISDVLRELTEFVNDGKEGYERAAEESTNPDFVSYYSSLAQQRREFSNELNALIRQHGGDVETDTTLKGKLYRQWMDVRAAFTGRDERSIVDSNIYGEEWAQKAYDDALKTETLPDQIRQLISNQRQASQEAYNRLQQMKAALS